MSTNTEQWFCLFQNASGEAPRRGRRTPGQWFKKYFWEGKNLNSLLNSQTKTPQLLYHKIRSSSSILLITKLPSIPHQLHNRMFRQSFNFANYVNHEEAQTFLFTYKVIPSSENIGHKKILEGRS